MFKLLAKWFIQEQPNAEDQTIRYRYGVLAGILGIVLNVVLFLGKIVAGVLSSSIAITADALNNLSDAGSSFISLLGFRFSGQQPDAKHPFGHGRIEYIAGMVVAVAILYMGVELLRSSIDRIVHPTQVTANTLTVVILCISILIKGYMAFYNRQIGKKINSPTMLAAATDSLCDAASTTTVLLSTLASQLLSVHLDGWCGLIVAALVFLAGWRTIRDAISPLLGQPPDAGFVRRIGEIVGKHPDIIGYHDLVVHDYGPGRRMISLHGEVPAGGDILALHDTIDNVEKELQQTLGCQAVIHMDPIVTDDESTNEMRERIAQLIKEMDRRMMIHDFRMVTGPTHTNLIFDVEVPFEVHEKDDMIKQSIDQRVAALDGDFFAVVQIDRINVGTDDGNN
jgi:cation diffusion facilitator family transporter